MDRRIALGLMAAGGLSGMVGGMRPVWAQTAAGETADLAPELLQDFTMGDPDAPIKVTEYASFTCAHCADFHTDVFKELKANYIDTGKVFFTYREVYFDGIGLWAAMLARCAGPERYFGFVDTYYSARDSWLSDRDPAVIADNLRRIGRVSGMSNDSIEACLQNKPLAEALVAAYQKNSAADGIEGTPSFIIDGERHSNMAYKAFATLLDAKLAAK